jgi:glycosyltransferase involved in cell wall biosynthesis
MNEKLKFFGKVDVREYYPKLDVFVLTSISEGQPLTILEAMAVGVPSVSTRVGSCEELINGRTEEDVALGPAGLVTNIGKPRETADAIFKIISDKELHDQMVESGYKRVDKYYREDSLIEKYRRLYKDYAAKSAVK